MITVGLTGGIACGKSSVARYLATLGAKFIGADRLAYKLAKPQKILWQIYVSRYGEKALNPDRTINRPYVAQVVFADEAELKWLNGATHPVLRRAMEREIRRHSRSNTRILFLDVPLWYEAGWDDLAPTVWAVYADEETQLKRLLRRDHVDEQAAKLRLSAQMSAAEKRDRADVVIDNSGSWDETRAQIDAAFAMLSED